MVFIQGITSSLTSVFISVAYLYTLVDLLLLIRSDKERRIDEWKQGWNKWGGMDYKRKVKERKIRRKREREREIGKAWKKW
jgi:hypothetical protein